MVMIGNYNFKDSEKKWQKFWETEKIYAFDKKSKKENFSIDTPPPYVSADHLHVGHAISYSQAEFIARYKRMQGFNVFYPMGFDDNGLPTERFVEKKYNINKNKITRQEFVKLCLQETDVGIKTYKKLWDSLGISVDWNLSYSTINKICQRISQKSFIDLYNKKRALRKAEPIIWCVHCQTALAQADLEDLEKSSYLNDIAFEAEDGSRLVISTTRPELIPACVALFVNKDDIRYKKILGKKVEVPLMNYKVPILADEKVRTDFGTGIMMVCTFGDIEDIERWRTNKLETRVIINKDGKFNELAGHYMGLKIEEARKKILEDLQIRKSLVSQKKINHFANIHERCSTPIEFNIVPQWYIQILDLKKELIEQGSKIKWHPDHMKVRYNHWVNNLKWDWCISRERFYGVPFPVWYCRNCSNVILADENDLPVDPTVDKPKIKSCLKCNGKEFIPETDVMDTWMTSSLTPLINSRWKEADEIKKIYPMELRPQAHEIIRTWAFYTVVKSFIHTKKIPWTNIMISGHGLDSKGQKISKSKGNMILVNDIINKYSADALRFFAASTKLGDDVLYQEKDVITGQKTITKLWNASKFVLTNIQEYKNENFKLELMDLWLLIKLNKIIDVCTRSFNEYEYSKAKSEIENFFWNVYCDYYLEIIKNRLYNETGSKKKSAQFTLSKSLLNILKLFAPIMPHITEEIYQLRFAKEENYKSIHISKWPVDNKKYVDKEVEKIGDTVIKIIQDVRKFKTSNKKSLKQEITIKLNKNDYKVLRNVIDDLKSVTNAKEITIGNNFEVSLI